jgi:hypothetical protein
MSYDLCLQAPRGTFLSRKEKDELVEKLRQETKLDEICEIIVSTPLSDSMICRGASRRLSKHIESGEFRRDEYEAFCASHGFHPNEGEQQADAAAYMFIRFKWGQTICAPCMPKRSDRDTDLFAYRLIVEFARRHGLVLHDPQVGEDINLDDPGELPPMMRPMSASEQRKAQLRKLFWPMVAIILILIGLALPWLFPEKFAKVQHPKNEPVHGLPLNGR